MATPGLDSLKAPALVTLPAEGHSPPPLPRGCGVIQSFKLNTSQALCCLEPAPPTANILKRGGSWERTAGKTKKQKNGMKDVR